PSPSRATPRKRRRTGASSSASSRSISARSARTSTIDRDRSFCRLRLSTPLLSRKRHASEEKYRGKSLYHFRRVCDGPRRRRVLLQVFNPRKETGQNGGRQGQPRRQGRRQEGRKGRQRHAGRVAN